MGRPPEERIALFGEAWDLMAASSGDVPIREWHVDELERRLAMSPPEFVSWDEVRDRLPRHSHHREGKAQDRAQHEPGQHHEGPSVPIACRGEEVGLLPVQWDRTKLVFADTCPEVSPKPQIKARHKNPLHDGGSGNELLNRHRRGLRGVSIVKAPPGRGRATSVLKLAPLVNTLPSGRTALWTVTPKCRCIPMVMDPTD